MIHDAARVESIRGRVAVQLKLADRLMSKVTNGDPDPLTLAVKQLHDIETVYLSSLERRDRTPDEEASWLFDAEVCLRQEEVFSGADRREI